MYAIRSYYGLERIDGYIDHFFLRLLQLLGLIAVVGALVVVVVGAPFRAGVHSSIAFLNVRSKVPN